MLLQAHYITALNHKKALNDAVLPMYLKNKNLFCGMLSEMFIKYKPFFSSISIEQNFLCGFYVQPDDEAAKTVSSDYYVQVFTSF